MSVVAVTDSPARGGGWVSERKGPLLELTNRRYKRTLFAQSDDINDGPETVLGYAGIPTIGSTYQIGNDTDSIAVCVAVRAEPVNDYPMLWKVEAEYDSSRVVDIALSNPLNLPPEITWTFAKYEYPLQRDSYGIPTVNSAGDRYDPPLTVELSRPVLLISRNEADYSETNSLQYIDAVNSDNFMIAAPFQAKINNIGGRLMCDIGVAYWKVDYEIEFQERTYAYFVLDQGFRNASGSLFRDPVDFSPMANPTLLNGRGYPMVDCYCQLTSNTNANQLTLTVQSPAGFSPQPYTYFPPGPKAGTPHWYFEIKIDNEIMQVVGGFGTNTWTVTRGYAGTTAATHNANATVQLQPYFLRFMPYKVLPFAPLNLPDLSGSITPTAGGG